MANQESSDESQLTGPTFTTRKITERLSRSRVFDLTSNREPTEGTNLGRTERYIEHL